MTKKQLSAAGWYALAGIGTLLLIVFALPVALGSALAAALEHPIRKVQARTGMGRGGASALCVSATLGALGTILWLVGSLLLRELQQLSRQLPALLEAVAGYAGALSRYLETLGAGLPGGVGDAFHSWAQGLVSGSGTLASGLYQRIFSLVSQVLSALPGSLFFAVTMILSCYFAAAELPRLREMLGMHLPEPLTGPVRRISVVLRRALGGWFRAQVLLMGVTFLLLLPGFLLLRVNSPLLLALGISVLDALPVFGTGTVLIPWALMAMMTGNLPLGMGLLILYGTAALVRNVPGCWAPSWV